MGRITLIEPGPAGCLPVLTVKPDLWETEAKWEEVHPYEEAYQDDDHNDWDVHKAYVKLREKLKELNDKANESGTLDAKESGETKPDRSRSRSERAEEKDKEKDTEKEKETDTETKKEKATDKETDRDKDRSRSRKIR